MQLSHDPAVVDAVFDEANLVSCAGLAPVMALAEQAGLSELLAERLTVASPNAGVKVTALVGGMVAGADSIDDMDLLRHGAMDRLFTGCGRRRRWGRSCARSRSGTCASWTRSPPGSWRSPQPARRCCPVPTPLAYVDIDDTVRETHGYVKQGAGFGYSGVNGLNALLGIALTPTAVPVIDAARLRKGSTNSPRGRQVGIVSDKILPPGQARARRVEKDHLHRRSDSPPRGGCAGRTRQ